MQQLSSRELQPFRLMSIGRLSFRTAMVLFVALLLLTACGGDAKHIKNGKSALDNGEFATAVEEFSKAIDGDLSPEERVEALLGRAHGYQAQQELDAALADYTAALAVTTDDGAPAGDPAQILSDRAQAYEDSQRWEPAIADLNQLLALQPDNVLTLLRRSELYVKTERWDDALADLDRTLQLQPDNTEALARRGYVHLQLRHFDLAIQDLKASLQGDIKAAAADLDSQRNLVAAYYRLAQALLNIGEYEQAIQNYNEALALATDNADKADIYAQRGFVYSEIGEPDLALADLDQAIALSPDLAIAYAYRSYVYSDQQRYEAAIADADRAVSLGAKLTDRERSALLHARALAHLYTGNYQQAIADATESIQLEGENSPKVARTYGIRSRAHRLLAEYEQAIADATKAIDIGASDVTALGDFYYQRARAYYDAGNSEAARADLEAALALGEATANDYALLGDIYLELGDQDKAIENYQHAISLDPENAWLHNYLGDVYYGMEDMGAAETEYRAAIRLNDSEPLFHENLALVLRLQEHYEEAIESYSRALALDENQPGSWLGRGIAYYILGQDDLAIADLERAMTFELPADAQEFAQSLLDEMRPQ